MESDTALNFEDVPQSDYLRYRGKCKEFCLELMKSDPTLTLVRGSYWDCFWGEQHHWWLTKPDGTIIDPTKDQFPTKGQGEYVPFDGFVICEVCEKRIPEKEAQLYGRYAFCSYEHAMSYLM